MNTFLRVVCAAACASVWGLGAAQAQSWRFDSAAYVSCREAQAMTPEQRRSLAVFLGEHAARQRGVRLPDGEHGVHLAMLVRGGCTLAPDTHLFAVIDRAIVAERDKLPKR
jgi:hypothetical protein